MTKAIEAAAKVICKIADFDWNTLSSDEKATSIRDTTAILEAALPHLREMIANEILEIQHTKATAQAEIIAGATVGETDAWDLALHHAALIAKGPQQ